MDEKKLDDQRLMQMGVATDIAPGPDGKPWIRTQVIIGVGALVWSVPVEQAEEFISGYERMFRQSVAVAKREAAGLIVASPDQMTAVNRAERRHNARKSRHGSPVDIKSARN